MPLLLRMQLHIFLKISSLLLNAGPDSVWNFDTVEKKSRFKAEKYLSSGYIGKTKRNWTTHITTHWHFITDFIPTLYVVMVHALHVRSTSSSPRAPHVRFAF